MSDETLGLSTQQKLVWAVIGMLVFGGALVAAETFTGGFNQADVGGEFNASSGPLVELGQTWQLRGGQPATTESINVSTKNDGWVNVSATATGPSLVVDSINDTWTNVSSVSGTASTNVTLQPSNKNFTRIGGAIDQFKYQEPKVEDDKTDFWYEASGSATVVVETNASDGTQYGAIDTDSNAGLDVAVANADGTIEFTDLDSGTHEVRIAKLGTLFIRNESSPHGKVTGSTATVRFFENEDDDPTIEEVEDTNGDGEIDLTGLPVNTEFIATVRAEGYQNRTVIIDDLAQQRAVFLAAKNVTTDQVIFQVDDQTGDFGAGSKLTIQKTINRSHYNGTPSGFSWTNIAGDEIGNQNQFVSNLIHEDRFRLRIESEEGDVRFLGSHVAEIDQTVTLTIENRVIEVENVSTDIAVGFRKDTDNNEIEFVYNDSEDKTTNLDVVIYERGNKSNEIHNQTHTGPHGDLFIEEGVSADEINESWVVEYDGDRDGNEISGVMVTGNRGDVSISAIPDWVKHWSSAFVILLIPTVLGGQRVETAAIVTVAIGGVLWWIQWLPPEVGIMSITLAGAIAVGFKMRSRQAGDIV